MKKYIIFLSIICIAFSATAQNALATSSIDPEADAVAIAKMRHKMDSIRQYRPTVAVVLAGGGAKGAAHIGALEYIEELGIPVDMVLGTSMGGLMGGLYAMGYPAKTIDSILVSTNWNVMMSDNVPSSSLSYQRRKYNETFAIRPPFFYEDEEWQKRQLDEYNARVINETENPYSSADMGEESLKQGFVANLPDGYLYGYNVYNIINSLSCSALISSFSALSSSFVFISVLSFLVNCLFSPLQVNILSNPFLSMDTVLCPISAVLDYYRFISC